MNKELTESQVSKVKIMTNAEIRSNAQVYANDMKYPITNSRYSTFTTSDYIKYAHIAGAHSRDPEIEALKAQLEYENEMAKFCIEDLKQEIEDLKADLAKVKKEKDLFRSAFRIVQSKLDRLKWNDASEILPPREVEGGSYSILVATSCDDSKEHYYLDRYDYQAKRWMYNSKSKVLKWRIEK